MRRSCLIGTLPVVSLAATALLLACLPAQGRQEESEPAARQEQANQAERLKTMRSLGAEASLTIVPVVMPDMAQARKEVAEAVGLLLEQAGMENLETTDVVFRLPAETGFDQAAKHFGEFVRQSAIKTDYALYAEFVGTPKTGPKEIRGVVVDKAGACVWVDRQTPDDPDFKRIKPDCPLTCCVLLTERLRGALDLTELDGRAGSEGKMAKLWAQKSGLPDKAERAAMQRRLESLKKAGPQAGFALFPVRIVGQELDAPGATLLAKLLNDRDLCQAEVADEQPKFDIKASTNEQRRLWDLARAFRDYMRKNPPDADYALSAEYMIHTLEHTTVTSVHFVVCDRTGEWVIVDFQNDHQGDFNSINPKSREDCGRLVVKRLEGYLR